MMSSLTFHWYGFIIGIAIVVGFLISEKKANAQGISEAFFVQTSLAVVLGGVIGARVWHVLTQLPLYLSDWKQAFFFWEGGLSILGALAGGFVALLVFLFWTHRISFLGAFLDSFAFALPLSQAIGRVANFVNQELYGLPTNLPWKIFIAPENRVPGYESFSYFHPLFAYEILLVLIGWILLSVCERRTVWKKGKGKFFVFYLMYYGAGRFFLDFIRIDTVAVWNGLGINQCILLAMELCFILWWKSLFLFKRKVIRKEREVFKRL